MNVPDCYRLLGLRTGASFEDVKASYRRLARQYHPDVTPGDQDQAKERFIQITEAYQRLVDLLQDSQPDDTPQPSTSRPASTVKVSVTKKTSEPTSATSSAHNAKDSSSKSDHSSPSRQTGENRVEFNANLSDIEQKLKHDAYQQLQVLLKNHRFPRAIALVEGLAQRIPQDTEVRQWQAITYQRWGRQLVNDRQFDKARIYLKKALKTDPHNRSLWSEVEREFRRLEQSVM